MTIDITKLHKPRSAGRNRSVTDEQIEMIKKLISQGYTQQSVADAIVADKKSIATLTKIILILAMSPASSKLFR